MNKESFINELRIKLKRLPKNEVDDILNYYYDYFEDAEKDESEVIKELGSPSTIASQILAEYAFNKSDEKSNGNSLMLVVLSIFAAPIALPLGIAAVALLFAGIIVIGALMFSLGAISFAVLVSGLAALVAGIFVMTQGPATGIMFAGLGMIAISIGMMLFVSLSNTTPKVYGLARNLVMKFLSKVNNVKLVKRGE